MSTRKDTPQWARYRNAKRLRRKRKSYHPEAGSMSNRLILEAPLVFSLIRNRSAVIEYISKTMSHINNGKFVLMDISHIDYTDYATVSLLIAWMMDSRTMRHASFKHLVVRTPDSNSYPGEIFQRCHFDGTVTKLDKKHNYFMSRTSKVINSVYTSEIIHFTSRSGVISGQQVINPMLVEIFSNTNNHATISGSSKIPWFVSIVDNDDVVCFSIIDLGIGIYESLRTNDAIINLPESEKMIVERMYENKQSRYLATQIPRGVFSSTKKAYRGKGLKQIHDLASPRIFNKFMLITNRAMIDMLDLGRIYSDAEHSLSGTVYYWEIRKDY